MFANWTAESYIVAFVAIVIVPLLIVFLYRFLWKFFSEIGLIETIDRATIGICPGLVSREKSRNPYVNYLRRYYSQYVTDSDLEYEDN